MTAGADAFERNKKVGIIASDLEGTLSAGAGWRGIGKYLPAHGRAGVYRRFFLGRLPGVFGVRMGLLDRDAFGHNWLVKLAGTLKGMSAEELAAMGEWVVENELWSQRRENVLAELAAHRAQGHRLVLASGSYEPVLAAFARRIGAEGIATPFEFAGGRATGKLAGPMTTGVLKAERLRAALNGEPLVAAYGDTFADVPMLEMAQSAVAVDPDERLARIARERGWRVIAG